MIYRILTKSNDAEKSLFKNFRFLSKTSGLNFGTLANRLCWIDLLLKSLLIKFTIFRNPYSIYYFFPKLGFTKRGPENLLTNIFIGKKYLNYLKWCFSWNSEIRKSENFYLNFWLNYQHNKKQKIQKRIKNQAKHWNLWLIIQKAIYYHI